MNVQRWFPAFRLVAAIALWASPGAAERHGGTQRSELATPSFFHQQHADDVQPRTDRRLQRQL